MGMRYLSSYLKSKGHAVKLIFLPYENPFAKEKDAEAERKRQEKLFNGVLEVCRSSDLIGFSLMTLDFNASAKLAQFLKQETEKPIVWGGIHPTLCPEECVPYADVVCVGEGEEFLLELVEKMARNADYSRIEGGWVKKNGEVVQNPLREIKDNLDDFPPMDFTVEDKWVIVGDELVPLTPERQKELFSQKHLNLKDGSPCYAYITQASRGCPHKCAYCSNSLFLEKFKGKGRPLRRRSAGHVMRELKNIKALYPYVNAINFYDDTFFAAPDEEIIEFAQAFKRKVGLPFFVLASPLTMTERKLAALVDAGCGHVQMGVQSGSERLNREVYNRPIPNKLTLEKMRLLNRYKDKIVPQYDFIVDCPYETNDDKLENVRFLSQIPKPYKIQLFSLVLYPHTILYERAVKDGLYSEELGGKRKSLAKFVYIDSFDFYSFAVSLSPNIPTPLYKMFTLKPVFTVFNNPLFDGVFKNLVKLAIWLNRKLKLTQKIIVDR